MTRITPRRLTTLQCSQIGLTLLRTFKTRPQSGSGQDYKLNPRLDLMQGALRHHADLHHPVAPGPPPRAPPPRGPGRAPPPRPPAPSAASSVAPPANARSSSAAWAARSGPV